VSRKHAFEMAFTGDFVDARTALDWGLVNRVVDPADLDAEVARMAKSLMEKPADVVAAGKAFFYRQLETPVERAYAEASEHIACNLLSDDGREGIAAFAEKRPPRWKA